MNDIAVAEPVAIAGAELLLLPAEQLHEHPKNPRQYFAEGPLAELEASIRKAGIRTPLIVWPRLDGGGYWIAAGARRFRAGKRAGLSAFPCLVREMSEADFLEVLTFENAQREDVHPLEEAASFRAYMDEALAEVPDVAGKAGKSTSHVYARLKLLDSIDEAQRACWDGKIDAGHLVLIARLSPADQRKALQHCEPPAWASEVRVSVRELGTWIKRNLQCDLTNAPFDRASTDLLPEAGSCDACPHRLGNFPDFDAANDLPHVCTRQECFYEKCHAHELLVNPPKPEPAAPIVPPPPPPAPKLKAKKTADEKRLEEEERKLQADREREQREREERERAAREAKLDAERGKRLAILRAVLEKVKWPPQREEIIDLLNDIVPDLSNELDLVVKDQGIEPGHRFVNTEKLSDVKLARLAVIAFVARDVDEYALNHGCEKLHDAAKRYGVDFRKVRAEAEGGTRREVIGKLPALDQAKKKAPGKKQAVQHLPALLPKGKKAAPAVNAKKGGKKK